MDLLKYFKADRGFSLLELLIYMAILAGFLVVIMNIFFMITSSSAKEEARAEVQQNLRFAVSAIINEARLAKNINVPASGESNVLELDMGASVIRFSAAGGILAKTTNLGLPGEMTENITTNNVTVSTTEPVPIFTRVGDTIQINLVISYNDNGKPNYKFSAKSQTAVSLMQ